MGLRRRNVPYGMDEGAHVLSMEISANFFFGEFRREYGQSKLSKIIYKLGVKSNGVFSNGQPVWLENVVGILRPELWSTSGDYLISADGVQCYPPSTTDILIAERTQKICFFKKICDQTFSDFFLT